MSDIINRITLGKYAVFDHVVFFFFKVDNYHCWLLLVYQSGCKEPQSALMNLLIFIYPPLHCSEFHIIRGNQFGCRIWK
jgi:hypothetical protein